MKTLGLALVAVGLALFFFSVAMVGGCATTGPAAECNPVMSQCNPADYPPLTSTLPKSPIPPPLSDWSNGEAPSTFAKTPDCRELGAVIDVEGGVKGPDDVWRYPAENVSKPCPGGKP